MRQQTAKRIVGIVSPRSQSESARHPIPSSDVYRYLCFGRRGDAGVAPLKPKLTFLVEDEHGLRVDGPTPGVACVWPISPSELPSTGHAVDEVVIDFTERRHRARATICSSRDY